MPFWDFATTGDVANARNAVAALVASSQKAVLAAISTLSAKVTTMSQTLQSDLDSIRASVTTVAADVGLLAQQLADLRAAVAAAGVPPEVQAQADQLATDAATAAASLDALAKPSP